MTSPLDDLKHAVASETLERALRVSDALHECGVRHVLIGGLAVGVHGHPRATKDGDFLVGDEAFESKTFLTYRDEIKDLVELAVTDLLAVPEALPMLAQELIHTEELTVISI